MNSITNILESINNLYPIEIVDEGTILVNDILDSKYNNSEYDRLEIVAILETSPLLRDKCFEIDIVYLYFLIDNNYLYIGFENMDPDIWYKLDINMEYIEEKIISIIKLYYCDTLYKHDEFEYNDRGILYGTIIDEMNDLTKIEKHICMNDFSEYFIWGSYWDEFPFRMEVSNKSYNCYELNKMLTFSMKQKEEISSISVRTKSSKSIVTFEKINDVIILDIKYNGFKNENITKYNLKMNNNIPDNIPLDLFGLINQFYFINSKKLLVNPTIENLSLSIEILKNDIDNTYNVLSNIRKHNNLSLEVKNYLDNIIVYLDINRKLKSIKKINKKELIELFDKHGDIDVERLLNDIFIKID